MNGDSERLANRFKSEVGFEKLTRGNIHLLAGYMEKELEQHTRFELWVNNIIFAEKKGKIQEVHIRLMSDYFGAERGGLGFEAKNNMVGFGGWMDEESRKPVKIAFEKWMDYIIGNKEVA